MEYTLYFCAQVWYTVLMKEKYKALYEKNYRFLQAHPTFKKFVLGYNDYVPFVFVASYSFLWFYAGFLTPVSPKELAAIFFSTAFALFFVSVLRFGISRNRPYENVDGVVPLKAKRSKGNSFPSRHLTCAGVIAACCLCYLPILGGVLLALCCGLIYTRFATGWHYPSDLLVGLLLGVSLGCIPFFM